MTKRPFPKSLNICLMAQKFPILGRASDHGFLWPIATGLVANGHRVTIIAGRSNIGKPMVERGGVTAYFLLEGTALESRETFRNMALAKFRELHTANQFDLVHSIDDSAVKVGQFKKEFKVAVSYDVNATQMVQVLSILARGQETVSGILFTAVAVIYKFLSTFYGGDRQLLKTANGIFVTTPQHRLMLERYYLYPDYHIYTVPYGIEIGNLEPRAIDQALKASLNIPASAQVAMTTSDMSEIDEMMPLLKAFEKVAIKKPNAYLIIMGNGPKWKELEFEIFNLALGRRVLMVGAIKEQDIPDYVSICDVFINLSARTTGFESTLIEAMAQEKLVVGSEVSAVANIIEDTIDGFLLRPADIQSLSELLIDIFSGTISRGPIGEKARNKVTNFFDTKKMVQATIEAYFRIINNSGFFQRQDLPVSTWNLQSPPPAP
jgi:glycosyltransferase involved in cell wall biosynthesis